MEKENITKVAEFFLKESGYKTGIEVAKDYIAKHLAFGTLLAMYDEKENVCAVCRWNIDTLDTATILDLYVREDYRRKNIIQNFLIAGLKKFPSVTAIKFERQKKYPGREFRIIPIRSILKGE